MNIVDAKLLDHLERLLVSHIYKEYLGQTWRGESIPKHLFRSFAANARRISDSFTEKRKDFREHYLRTKESRSGYLLYFHLASMVRSLCVLEEMHKRGGWPDGSLKVLDVGAGSAPSLWALALATREWGGKIESVVAVDHERQTLKDAKILWQNFLTEMDIKLPLQTRTLDLGRSIDLGSEKYDIIVASNVLNELAGNRDGGGLRLFDLLLTRYLNETGSLVLVEPALSLTSRNLQRFRDRLLESRHYFVPFPCGHQSGCPLNQEPRDWCHFETRWQPPPIRKRIEKELGHQSGTLKYSYLVIRNSAVSSKPSGLRVLSDPLASPQGDRLLLCTPQGKVALKFNRREAKFGKVLDSFRRGDVLQSDPEIFVDVQNVRKNRYAYEIDLPEDAALKKL